MFQKNLGALKNKNPKLAEQLSSIALESINTIDVAQAENQDYILAYKGVPLHDTKDPTREAKSTWFRSVKTELKMNDIQVVFGLGLGYLFKRAYVSAPSKIFLFEPSLDILRFVFEYVDFSAEINDERVYFSNDEDDLLNKFESVFLVGDNVEFLFLPPYAQLFGEKLITITDNILNAIKNKGVDMNVVAFNSERSVKNILAHMTIYPQIRPVDYFKGKFEGKTALVLSAGPSLKDDLEKIKENKDKFVIFAIATVLKFLIQNGVEPDFLVSADAHSVAVKYADVKDKIKNINLIFEGRSEDLLVRDNFASKICYFSSPDSVSKAIVEHVSDKEIKLHEAAPTVTILAYYVAKILGFSKVVYSGLDLAIIDNRLYADDTPFKFLSENKIELTAFNGTTFQPRITKIKSADGKEVYTREDYLLFIKQFEAILADASDGPEIISTSTKGAFINGMNYKPFDEIAKDTEGINLDIKSLIKDVYKKSETNWNIFTKGAKEFVSVHFDDINDLMATVDKLEEQLKDIKKFANLEEPDTQLLQMKYDDIKQDLSDTREKIIGNIFLSVFMQVVLLDYVKNYSKEYLQSIEIFRNNIDLELHLCDKMHLYCKSLKFCMESVLK